MDIFEKIESNPGELARYYEIGHEYFVYPKLAGELGPRMKFKGKELLNWSLNNYLGLANHPEVRKTDAEACARWGLAYPMGSRLLTGNTDLHEEFERRAASFVKKEAAFLLNYGYQGMVSIIQTIVSRKDVIVYDQLSHACILDGMMLTGAKRFVFAHNDMTQLEDRLRKATRLAGMQGGGVLVITEGVFGMKGDLGNLAGIAALKEKYAFRLLVDDAHGFGVMGKSGAGTDEHFGVQDHVDLYFTTFAKSMAGIGAFVAGKTAIVRFLKYNMRSQVYAKALPMPMVEGALKRLELLQTRPELREKLWKIVNAIQSGMKQKGFEIGPTQSPVTPVYLRGATHESANLIMDMRENLGVFVSVVTYPVIEKGHMILRIIPTAAHSMEDVDITLVAFSEVARKLKDGLYAGQAEVRAAL